MSHPHVGLSTASLPLSLSLSSFYPWPLHFPGKKLTSLYLSQSLIFCFLSFMHRSVNASISRRRQLLSAPPITGQAQCLTGNPIDDCWRCDPDWGANRQRLADCAIGFGRAALGGKGGRFYVVTDSSDRDAMNPIPGTLRHAVIQDEPLWIIFQSSMVIKLRHELIFNSYKTVDGRGADVRITGNGCITLQYVSNVIIHNVHVYDCLPSGDTIVRSSPSHAGWRGRSDGDGISIFSARNIWIDHCALSHCTDGLIDAIMGSTAITISNSYFTHHDEVMLLGHNDEHLADSGMQVRIFLKFATRKTFVLVWIVMSCCHIYVIRYMRCYTR